jgi:hypothetical protein
MAGKRDNGSGFGLGAGRKNNLVFGNLFPRSGKLHGGLRTVNPFYHAAGSFHRVPDSFHCAVTAFDHTPESFRHAPDSFRDTVEPIRHAPESFRHTEKSFSGAGKWFLHTNFGQKHPKRAIKPSF